MGQCCFAPSIADQTVSVWKTISLGTFHSVINLREALEAERCGPANATNSVNYKLATSVPCGLGDSANEILGRPEFDLSRTPSQIHLVLLSGKDLGFRPDSQPSLRDTAR